MSLKRSLVVLVAGALFPLLRPVAGQAADQVTITDVSASPVRLYPLVQDGYRDATTVTFTLNQVADEVTASVTDEQGNLVEDFSLDAQPAGIDTWSWHGQRIFAPPVPAGVYTIVLQAVTEESGTAQSTPVKLRVTTGVQTVTATKHRTGHSTSSTRHTRHCSVRRTATSARLACHSGHYARADYRVRVPRSARHVRFSVTGRRGCCHLGRVIESGRRVSPTVYRVRVEVTRQTSFTVRSLELSYTSRRRV